MSKSFLTLHGEEYLYFFINILNCPGMSTVTNHLTNIMEITLYLALTLQFWQKINDQTSKFARKLHFLGMRKVLNLGLKAEKPFQNLNHTEDLALGSHPRDNVHVTH